MSIWVPYTIAIYLANLMENTYSWIKKKRESKSERFSVLNAVAVLSPPKMHCDDIHIFKREKRERDGEWDRERERK